MAGLMLPLSSLMIEVQNYDVRINRKGMAASEETVAVA